MQLDPEMCPFVRRVAKPLSKQVTKNAVDVCIGPGMRMVVRTRRVAIPLVLLSATFLLIPERFFGTPFLHQLPAVA